MQPISLVLAFIVSLLLGTMAMVAAVGLPDPSGWQTGGYEQAAASMP
jgi:hypothetical protein